MYISDKLYDSLPQFHVHENDLLITVVGTLGKVAIATKGDEASIFSCKSTIIRSARISPFYLLAYLNCSIGRLFSLRGKRGAIQEGLNLSDLREIQVFIPSNDFQRKIESVVKVAFEKSDEGSSVFKDAQSIFLMELGLSKWKPKHQLSFVKSFSASQSAGRFDAEYFQPKYDEIIAAIKASSDGWELLGNLVSIKKSVEVGSGQYLKEGVPFVRVRDISPFEIGEEKYISEALYKELNPDEKDVPYEKSKRHQPEQGEILFSKDGTPGIAYYLAEEPMKMIPSGALLRLKTKSDKVNNEYLTLVLNSMLTKEQANRDVGGSIILHWRPDQVKETVVPILPKDAQAQIQTLVVESFDLRKQSKHLLECAKHAVEMAIETDEQAAGNWLEKEIGEGTT